MDDNGFSNKMFDLVDFLFDIFIYVYQSERQNRFRSDGLEIFFRTFEAREDKRERDDWKLNIDDC